MKKTNAREVGRQKRHKRIRKKISGDSERPRLCVHRSSKNIFIQVIDDQEQKTLISCSSLDKDFSAPKEGGKVGAAQQLGSYFADKLKEKGIQKINFDRGGYLYHGRVKAVADGLRENGIEF